MDGRRALSFETLDEVMPEVGRLSVGHRTVGRWALGQICHHLAVAIRDSMGGLPVAGARPPMPMPGRAVLAARHRPFRSGRIPDGVATSARSVPGPGLDARAEADALRDALRQFAASAGPFVDHPVLGPMTREDWARFHGIHCAHHLGFALPDPTA